MDLRNKKVVFLGDSITEGVGASSKETCFVSVFGDITGARVVNYGISGTRIARKHRKSDNAMWDLCFLDRVAEMDADADVVVVFGGTNDFGHGDGGLGVFEDTDEYTFYGAVHSLVKRLVSKYPEAKIVFMTPLHRISENVTTNEIGLPCAKLKVYVDALREVLEYYSIPVLDLFRESGLQPAIPVIKERYMPDGLHPSDAGARLIAERLAGYLSAFGV